VTGIQVLDDGDGRRKVLRQPSKGLTERSKAPAEAAIATISKAARERSSISI